MATSTNMAVASRIRRKPLATYKSPLPGEHVFLPPDRGVLVSKPKKTSITSKTSSNSSSSTASSKDTHSSATIRRRPPMSPPLPLFHPLGHLAMSLPPLDPALYGLPPLAVPDELEERQPSRSSKRSSVRPQEIEEEAPAPTVSAVAAVAARENKERASPRKRRNGGGGGGSKRKRKEVDDGDATYPAKRTRPSRGAANQNAEDEVTVDIAPPNEVPVELLSDLVEKRRSTRSRGGAVKRRESSESETASISVNAAGSLAKAVADPIPASDAPKVVDGGPTTDVTEQQQDDSKEEKEEGELSA